MPSDSRTPFGGDNTAIAKKAIQKKQIRRKISTRAIAYSYFRR
ncbi:MAG: hypothetical protein ACFFFC_04765 [Candidatus Thorarchaeota archaeon]